MLINAYFRRFYRFFSTILFVFTVAFSQNAFADGDPAYCCNGGISNVFIPTPNNIDNFWANVNNSANIGSSLVSGTYAIQSFPVQDTELTSVMEDEDYGYEGLKCYIATPSQVSAYCSAHPSDSSCYDQYVNQQDIAYAFYVGKSEHAPDDGYIIFNADGTRADSIDDALGYYVNTLQNSFYNYINNNSTNNANLGTCPLHSQTNLYCVPAFKYFTTTIIGDTGAEAPIDNLGFPLFSNIYHNNMPGYAVTLATNDGPMIVGFYEFGSDTGTNLLYDYGAGFNTVPSGASDPYNMYSSSGTDVDRAINISNVYYDSFNDTYMESYAPLNTSNYQDSDSFINYLIHVMNAANISFIDEVPLSVYLMPWNGQDELYNYGNESDTSLNENLMFPGGDAIGDETCANYGLGDGGTYTVTFKTGNTTLGTQSFTYRTAQNLNTIASMNANIPDANLKAGSNGWTFAGWATGYNTSTHTYTNGQSVNNLTTESNGNVTLYAIWKRNVNWVYYDGTTLKTTTNVQYYYNTDSTTATQENTRIPGFNNTNNWTRKCWVNSTEAPVRANGCSWFGPTETTYALKTGHPNNFYAQYERTVQVKYLGNGSTGGSTAAQTKTQYFNAGASSAVALDNFTLATNGFTKTGYTFNKWALDSASGTQYAADASYAFPNTGWTSSASKTMYATWTAKTGLSCSAGYYLPANSETCTLCPAGSYCPGFSGWTYTGAEKGKTACTYGTYSDTDGATSCTACPTLGTYASRVDTSQTNSYPGGYGYWTQNSVHDRKTGCRAAILENDSRGDYKLSCQITCDSSGNNCDYGVTPGTSKCMAGNITCNTGYHSNPGINGNGNIWGTSVDTISPCLPNTYTISFNANNGSGGQSSSVTATYNSAMPEISTTKPTRSGYAFGGWYTATSGGVQVYDRNGAPVKNVSGYTSNDNTPKWIGTSDTQLYARWTQTYPVTLNKNDGTNTSVGTLYAMPEVSGSGLAFGIYYDSAATRPAWSTNITNNSISLPTRTGYTFAGFYDTSAATGGNLMIDSTGYMKNCGTEPNGLDCKCRNANAGFTIYARWTAKTGLSCSAGYYFPANSETCTLCPAGKYCTGFSNFTYTGSVKGIDGNVSGGYYSTGGGTSATPTENGNGCVGSGTTCGKTDINYYCAAGAKKSNPTSTSDSANGSACGACPTANSSTQMASSSYPETWYANDGLTITSIYNRNWGTQYETGKSSITQCYANYTGTNNRGSFSVESVAYNPTSGKYDNGGGTYYVSIKPGYYADTRYSDTYCNTSTHRMYYRKALPCPAGSYCPGYTSGVPVCSSGTYGTTLGLNECPTNYQSNPNTKVSAQSSCQTKCAAGTQVTSANNACTTPSGSWYTAEHYVNYGSTSGNNVESCSTGYSTPNTTTKTDHDSSSDCSANTYNITYKDGSTTLTGLTPISYTYGTNTTIDAKPTKSGNIFAGWCTDSTLTSCAGEQTISTTATDNKTFYAKWETPKFTLTTSSTDSFQFRLSAEGNFVVDCGNGGTLSGTGVLGNAITRTNTTTDATYTCSWGSSATQTIRFGGLATGYSTSISTAAIRFNTSYTNNIEKITGISGSLGQIFPTLSNPTVGTGQPRFYLTFSGASNMLNTNIDDPNNPGKKYALPPTLFDGVSGAPAEGMFNSTFSGCRGLTGTIPPTLFCQNPDNPNANNCISGAPAVGMFYYTFFGCSNLTGSIPAGLFGNLSGAPAINMFSYTFHDCSGLSGSIPGNLFAGISGAPADGMFYGTFSNCSNLTGSIPANLFAGISGAPAASMFESTFYGCSNLTGSIPANLFAGISGAPADSMFNTTFNGCSNLTGSIPANLFAGISGAPAVAMFFSTFFGCDGLTGFTDGTTTTSYVPSTFLSNITDNTSVSSQVAKMFARTGLASTCPAGTYTTTRQQFDNAGSPWCSPCPSAYPNSADGATAQSACYVTTTAGNYVATANDTTQTTCAAGGYCPGNVNVNYGSTGGRSECTAGTYQDQTGQSSCKTATAGHYVSETGAITQTECSNGTYQDLTGQSSCKSCPAFTNVTEGAAVYENDQRSAPVIAGNPELNDDIGDCAGFVYYANEFYLSSEETDGIPMANYNPNLPANTNNLMSIELCAYNKTTNAYTSCLPYNTVCKKGYYMSQNDIARSAAINILFSGNTPTQSEINTLRNSFGAPYACQQIPSGYYTGMYDMIMNDDNLNNDEDALMFATHSGMAVTGGQTINPITNQTVSFSDYYKQCPSAYPNSAAASWKQSDCYTTTTAGNYVATANAAQTACAAGGYCPGNVNVNYGSTGGRTECTSGTFSPDGAKTASQCGHLLHVGNNANDVVYLHGTDAATTQPALHVKMPDGTMWHANLSQTRTKMSNKSDKYMPVKIGNTTYYVCDKTICGN